MDSSKLSRFVDVVPIGRSFSQGQFDSTYHPGRGTVSLFWFLIFKKWFRHFFHQKTAASSPKSSAVKSPFFFLLSILNAWASPPGHRSHCSFVVWRTEECVAQFSGFSLGRSLLWRHAENGHRKWTPLPGASGSLVKGIEKKRVFWLFKGVMVWKPKDL